MGNIKLVIQYFYFILPINIILKSIYQNIYFKICLPRFNRIVFVSK
jgi:hypothetical protein